MGSDRILYASVSFIHSCLTFSAHSGRVLNVLIHCIWVPHELMNLKWYRQNYPTWIQLERWKFWPSLGVHHYTNLIFRRQINNVFIFITLNSCHKILDAYFLPFPVPIVWIWGQFGFPLHEVWDSCWCWSCRLSWWFVVSVGLLWRCCQLSTSIRIFWIAVVSLRF